MIRAIILCCDERTKRRMSLRDLPGAAANLVTTATQSLPQQQQQQQQYDSHQQQQSRDPSLEKSYGDGLNCGYMQVASSHQSPIQMSL